MINTDARATADQPDPSRPFPPDALPDLETLLADYQARLLRYAWRITRCSESAQDVVQEVFVRYHQNPPREVQAARISTWLYRVAHNLCIDLIRKESRMRAQAEQMPPPAAARSPRRDLEAEDAKTQLTRLLEHLNENQRTVLILKVQEEKSYREISEITGLSVSNVGFLIHQAMKKLSAVAREMEVI